MPVPRSLFGVPLVALALACTSAAGPAHADGAAPAPVILTPTSAPVGTRIDITSPVAPAPCPNGLSRREFHRDPNDRPVPPGTTTSSYAVHDESTPAGLHVWFTMFPATPLGGYDIEIGCEGTFQPSQYQRGHVTVVDDPVSNYVRAVYADFGRTVDPLVLQQWVLSLRAGTPYSAVATSLTHEQAYLFDVLSRAYNSYLRRGADPAGLNSWSDALAHGLRDEALDAGLLSSQEYYQTQGSSQDAVWVAALYRDVLGRTPTRAEVDGWVQALPAVGRGRVSLGFTESAEHLQAIVGNTYQQFLHRASDPGGLADHTRALQRGLSDEGLAVVFTSSAEYVARATAVAPR